VWAGLAVASLLLSLAAGNPLYHLLRFLPGFADFRVPARFIFIFTFAAAMLAGLGYELVLSRRRLKAFHASVMAAAVIAALSVVDLGHFGRSVAPLAGPEVFRARPRIVQFLKEEPSWGRSLVVPPIPFYANWSPPGGWADNPDGWLEARVYLPADVPQSFDLRIVGGYAGFVDPRHAQFFEAAVARASQNHDYSLYSLVGTRHFVMPPSLPLSGLPGAGVPPFRVYLNRDAFPRAFAVGKVAPWADGQDSLGPTLALAEAKALRTTAVVAGDLTISTGARCEISGVAETRPERVLVRAHSDGESLVVLNERWDRGWRARVDGRSARLYETDCVLMAAPIGAGEHTVEFLYQPRGLIIGRAVSLASLVVALAMLAMSARRRR
jgi:hypothetical protein